jgi:hypothetical protein
VRCGEIILRASVSFHRQPQARSKPSKVRAAPANYNFKDDELLGFAMKTKREARTASLFAECYCRGARPAGQVTAAVACAPVGSKRITPEASVQKLR